MITENQGPWGSDDKGGKPSNPWGNGANGSGGRNQKPSQSKGENDIDRLIRENKENLRKMFGGGGGNRPIGKNGSPQAPSAKPIVFVALIVAVIGWLYMSFYQIEEGTRGLKMRFGQYVQTLEQGLNFAAWPVYEIKVVDIDSVRDENIGTVSAGQNTAASSLMLTSDENIVDVQFVVQWKVSDPVAFEFNLVGQRETVVAMAESTMRDVVAQLPLIPILNTERTNIPVLVKQRLQSNLDQYNSGVQVVEVTLAEIVPPRIVGSDGEVKDVAAAFRKVQDAEARREDLQNQARRDANTILGGARAEAAKQLEAAEGYRASAVNSAEGDASRFLSVLEEYKKAPEVTRRRLYLETMQSVYGGTNKVLMDGSSSEGVVPYLPLNELTTNRGTGANQ